MKKTIKISAALFTLLLIIFTLTAAVYAQQESSSDLENTDTENADTENTEETVYINAESLDYQDEITLLSGGIEIRKDDTIIKSQKGELFRDEERMLLKEDVKLDYPDGEVSSEEMTAFLNEEEYIFENNVVLKYQLSEEDEFMLLESQYLKIYGEDKSFNAEREIEIDYQDQKFRGDLAEYDGSSEELQLTGNVEIEEDGDWIRSDRALFNLSEGEEGYKAEGNVEIRMILD